MGRNDPIEGSGALDEDAALLRSVGRGEKAAFAKLYERNASSVVNFAYRFVQDRARAEELAQEIFLKLFQSAGRYEPTARFKTYLFRVAANHCLNERRRGASRAVPEPADRVDLQAPEGEGPDAALAGREMERTLARALAELPPRERAAFVMCRFEGLPYREIAQALDASEPAIKSLIHRATVAVARAVAPAADPVVEGPRAASRV